MELDRNTMSLTESIVQWNVEPEHSGAGLSKNYCSKCYYNFNDNLLGKFVARVKCKRAEWIGYCLQVVNLYKYMIGNLVF